MASEGRSALSWRKSTELFVLASLAYQPSYCSGNPAGCLEQGVAQGGWGSLWLVMFAQATATALATSVWLRLCALCAVFPQLVLVVPGGLSLLHQTGGSL